MSAEEKRVSVKAYAKINLFLDVTGRREDGYHFVNMAMQSLSLHDTLTLALTPEPGLTLSIKDTSGAGRFADLEADDRNLAVRAIGALAEVCGDRFPQDMGLDMCLKKVIPTEAGLAGGSADAAAALLGADKLLGLGLSDEELAAVALKLGADIPYCLRCGTMRAEGIGEILSPLPDMPDCAILLAKPAGSASTKEIYTALDDGSDRPHPDWNRMEQALSQDACAVAQALANVMEPVTAAIIPEIDVIADALKEHGALGARMTGSGSAVFGIFADAAGAQAAMEAMKKHPAVRDLFLTRPISAAEAQDGRFAE